MPIVPPAPKAPGNWQWTGSSWVNKGVSAPNGGLPPGGKPVQSPVPRFAPPGSVATPYGPVNLHGIQQQLLRAGYKLPAKSMGKLDAVTKSALADFLKVNPNHPLGQALATALKGTKLTGKRDTKAWNQVFGEGRPSVYRPRTGPGGLLTPVGNDPNYGGMDTGGGTISGPNLNIPTQGYVDPSTAGKGLTTRDAGLADKQAGLEYDPQIHDYGIQQVRQPIQAAQNQRDINNWQQQVLDAQSVAAGRDATATDTAGKTVTDATQAIIASLGGGANAGNEAVGASGADSAGTIAALGANEAQYNNDIVPLLKSEGAAQLSGQRARDTQAAQDLVQKLAELRGQRGQSVNVHQSDNDAYNNSVNDTIFGRQTNIRDYNANQRQTNFANRLDIYKTQVAAILSGAKVQAGLAKAGTKGAFNSLTAIDKAKLRNSMLGAVQQKVKAGAKPAEVVSYLNDLIGSQGWSMSNPQVKDFTYRVLRLAGVPADPKLWGK